MAVTNSHIPRILPRCLVSYTSDGTYISDPNRNLKVKLSLPAAYVMDLCDGALTVEEISAFTAERFKSDIESVSRDVYSLLEQLVKVQLISLTSYNDRYKLESIVIELTGECNLNCQHCIFANRREENLRLSQKNIDKAIVGLAKIPTARVFLSGGEPTLHPELCKTIHKLKSNGTEQVIVLSNGVLIDKEYALNLKIVGVDEVRISIDGTVAAINDQIRGVGSWQHAMNALENLRFAGINTGVVYTACRKNKKDWLNLVEFANSVSDTLYAGEIVYWGNAHIHEKVLALSDNEVAEFRLMLAEKQARLNDSFRINPEQESGDYRRGMCVAGREKCTITCKGTVIPCSMFDQPEFIAGDLALEDLETIWGTSRVFHNLRKLSAIRFSQCGECDYRLICGGGCRAKSYALHGRMDAAPCPTDCGWRLLFFDEIKKIHGVRAMEFIGGGSISENKS